MAVLRMCHAGSWDRPEYPTWMSSRCVALDLYCQSCSTLLGSRFSGPDMHSFGPTFSRTPVEPNEAPLGVPVHPYALLPSLPR